MPSTVYFLPQTDLKKIKQILPKFSGRLGVKVHFGEENNTTFIPAQKIKKIIGLLEEPVLVECNVLYKSPRQRADTHRQLAQEHGFDFAPIDILDGELGEKSFEAPVKKGQHFSLAFLGKGLKKYDSLLVISHFKGHIEAGFGGALKNLGMGLASRQGKLALHASIKHQVNPERCISCGTCLANCPVKAISYNSNKKAVINQKICISCSMCLALCPEQAISIPWSSTAGNILQQRIAEYALAAIQNRICYYINFLINITDECDCYNGQLPILTPDIGILFSPDPVAIDQASYDLIVKQYPLFEKHNGLAQIKHGQEIGLGAKEYQLIKL